MYIVVPFVRDMVQECNRLAKEKGDYSMLDPMHHFTSGYKSIFTDFSYYGIDELRQACGGAGFSLAS